MNSTTIFSAIGFVALVAAIAFGVVLYAQGNSDGVSESEQTLYTWACEDGCIKYSQIAFDPADGPRAQKCSLQCIERYGG